MRGSISGAEDHGVAVLHLFALCQHLSSYKHDITDSRNHYLG